MADRPEHIDDLEKILQSKFSKENSDLDFPSDDIWDNISMAVDAKRRKRRGLFFLLFGLVVLMLGSILFFNIGDQVSNSEHNKQVLSEIVSTSKLDNAVTKAFDNDNSNGVRMKEDENLSDISLSRQQKVDSDQQMENNQQVANEPSPIINRQNDQSHLLSNNFINSSSSINLDDRTSITSIDKQPQIIQEQQGNLSNHFWNDRLQPVALIDLSLFPNMITVDQCPQSKNFTSDSEVKKSPSLFIEFGAHIGSLRAKTDYNFGLNGIDQNFKVSGLDKRHLYMNVGLYLSKRTSLFVQFDYAKLNFKGKYDIIQGYDPNNNLGLSNNKTRVNATLPSYSGDLVSEIIVDKRVDDIVPGSPIELLLGLDHGITTSEFSAGINQQFPIAGRFNIELSGAGGLVFRKQGVETTQILVESKNSNFENGLFVLQANTSPVVIKNTFVKVALTSKFTYTLDSKFDLGLGLQLNRYLNPSISDSPFDVSLSDNTVGLFVRYHY